MSPVADATPTGTKFAFNAGDEPYQLDAAFFTVPFNRVILLRHEICQLIRSFNLEDGEPAPTHEVIKVALDILIDAAVKSEIAVPDVSLFFGSVQLSWRRKRKDVTLISSSGAQPRIQYYEWRGNEPSAYHLTQNATSDSLLEALHWLEQEING